MCCSFNACQLNAYVVREEIRNHDSDVEDVFGDPWVDLENRVHDQRPQCGHQGDLVLMCCVLQKR